MVPYWLCEVTDLVFAWSVAATLLALAAALLALAFRLVAGRGGE